MTNLKEMGMYLGRQVLLQGAAILSDIEVSDLSSAVVMLWISDDLWKTEDFLEAIRGLINGKPLGISVGGKRVDKSFSLLLETLSTPSNSTSHIMTGVIGDVSLSEAVSNFLIATYPDDLRFDDWQEYQIIAIGDKALQEQMQYSINKIILVDKNVS